MAKLIGTAPNQVPTNADLGTMAYVDKDNFEATIKEAFLAKMEMTLDPFVGSGANCIFVYDTKNDSDGGAWRERVKNTSWYNEEPSNYRGNRKDFPQVAVIVTRNTEVIIYDADDPSFPMWMRMDSTLGYFPYKATNGYVTNVIAINGIVSIGANVGWSYCSFIADEMVLNQYTGARQRREPWKKGIVARHDATGGWENTSIPWYITIDDIRGNEVTSQDAKVLPGAPIDPATGLPRPTFLIGTNYSVFCAHNDRLGYNFEFSNGSYVHNVAFTWDNKVALTVDFSGAAGGRYLKIINLPHANFTDGSYYATGTALSHIGTNNFPRLHGNNEDVSYYHPRHLTSTGEKELAMAVEAGYQTTWQGLVKLYGYEDAFNSSNALQSASAFVTDVYNTGWMMGDIYGALLCDTDTDDLVETQYVPNHAFSTTGNWGLVTGYSISGGSLSYDGTGGQYSKSYSDYFEHLEVGKQYILHFRVTALSGGTISVGVADNVTISDAWGRSDPTGTGIFQQSFYAGSTTAIVTVQNNTADQTFSIDYIAVREATGDRSANRLGAYPLGTITKEPVADGAELVAYSGFSNSNRFLVPDNGFFPIGDGDFYISCWVKMDDGSIANGRILHFESTDGDNDYSLGFDTYNSGGVTSCRLYTFGSDLTSWNLTGTIPINDGQWHHCMAVRRNQWAEIWVDGILSQTDYNADEIGIGGDEFHGGIGADPTTGGAVHAGALSLLKFGRSAPSHDLIQKVYNEEKLMFREGAKVTLHGSQDDVNSLDYDQNTGLLHVGNAQGRSVFSGLVRVDQTDSPTTISIGASGNLVVDE